MTTGTVFDIGYQRYTGAREGRVRGRKAVYKDGFRNALGLGRGARPKVLPWGFIGILAAIGLILAIVAGAANTLGGPGAAEKAHVPSHSDYNGIAAVIMYVFAAIVAPEVLCRDRREGVINLYLVRPLTGSDYIASRWAAFMTVVTGAALLPQIILFAGLSMGALDPTAYLTSHWTDVPKFIAAALIMSAFVTTLALLVASFTTRRAYASVFLIGLFIITAPFTVGLAEETAGKAGQWISMFNLMYIPVYANDVIFGQISQGSEDAPASLLPGWIRLTWCLAWTVVPGFILWMRYRRLKP